MTNEPKMSHLEKIFWPELGISKGQLIDYYRKISSYILPHLKDRPISMNRFPDGIYGEHFYQKNFTFEQPKWLKSIKVPGGEKLTNYLLCQNIESLLYLVNFGCIDINPWLSSQENLNNPDFCVIDLDPLEIDFKYVCQTARTAYDIFIQYGITSYIKTSGATGMHIYIPLSPIYSYEQSKNFGKILASLINQRMPEITSIERVSAKRKGKVYVDFLQNNPGQTLASVYSVRPVKEASVSCPLKWEELNCSIRPADFTMDVALQRIRKFGDIFAPVLTHKNDIKKIIENIESGY